MRKTGFFLVFVPVLVGFLALVGERFEAGEIRSFLRIGGAVLFGGFFVIGFVVMRSAVGRKQISPRASGEYEKPYILAARWDRSKGVGELEIRAGNSSHVSRDLSLPVDSYITAIERKSLYRVTFSASLPHLTETARSLGFRGRIEA
jgi:hypothetical protein